MPREQAKGKEKKGGGLVYYREPGRKRGGPGRDNWERRKGEKCVNKGGEEVTKGTKSRRKEARSVHVLHTYSSLNHQLEKRKGGKDPREEGKRKRTSRRERHPSSLRALIARGEEEGKKKRASQGRRGEGGGKKKEKRFEKVLSACWREEATKTVREKKELSSEKKKS